MRYTNFVFDLYGTLLDIHTDETRDEPWHKTALLLDMYGIRYTPEELKKAYFKEAESLQYQLRLIRGSDYVEIDLEEVWRSVLENGGRNDCPRPKITPELVTAVARMYRVLSCDRIANYEDAVTVLRWLKEQGAHLYLLSNAQAVFTTPEIRLCGLEGYFDKIVLSSERGWRKPAPELIGALMSEAGLDPKDTVVIGNDMETDMASALFAGTDAIYINTYDHAFDQDQAMEAKIRALSGNYSTPIYRIGRLKELMDW